LSNPSEFHIYPSPIQYNFLMSGDLENMLVGPRGEGKTEAGIMAMTFHASLQDKAYRPMPWVVIRDTWANLERTTLKSLKQPRPGSFAASIRSRLEFKNGGKQVVLPGYWEAFLFGIDSIGDLDNLQSLQLAGLWLEEAAPAANDDIGGGVGEDAWAIGISSLRHPVTTNRRAQITENYPDEDHWTWQRFSEQRIGRLFRIPRGENKHIDQDYRDNMARALANRPDLMARLVEGRPAQVTIGEAVTPEYREDTHRSKNDLDPIPRLATYRFWDGGLNPTCVFAQVTPRGFFVVLDTLRGENIGMKQLINNQVKPLIARRYGEITEWLDYGDEALKTPEQSSSEETAAKVINNELGTHYHGGVQGWKARREAWKDLLTRMIDGRPMFQISRHERILHRALNGGWHYYKDAAGKVLKDKPVKDLNSHPGDAVSHGIAKIFKGLKPKPPRATHSDIEFNPVAPNYGRRPVARMSNTNWDPFGRTE
jgi:hypothetical protein